MKFIKLSSEIISESKKIYIYRIQHSDSKYGPYNAKMKNGKTFEDNTGHHIGATPKYTPNPRTDKSLISKLKPGDTISNVIKFGIFGFSSLQQIRRWFTDKVIDSLLENEFEIVKKLIDPEDIIIGDHQVIVKKLTWIQAPSKKVTKYK